MRVHLGCKWIIFDPTWTIYCAFGQIFIMKVAKYWKNNLFIWSHWSPHKQNVDTWASPRWLKTIKQLSVLYLVYLFKTKVVKWKNYEQWYFLFVFSCQYYLYHIWDLNLGYTELEVTDPPLTHAQSTHLSVLTFWLNYIDWLDYFLTKKQPTIICFFLGFDDILGHEWDWSGRHSK